MASGVGLAFNAAPALAGPLLEVPGHAGATVSYRFAGTLGQTGLHIEAMPTMLLVRRLAPGSVAAIANVPDPTLARLRLAAVNGRAVERMPLSELLAAFNPSRRAVLLTFARKGEREAGEQFVGPYELPLEPRAIAEAQARWLSARGRFAEAQALHQQRQTGGAIDTHALLLAARDVAAGGDYLPAIAWLKSVPTDDPLVGEAQHLSTRYRAAYYHGLLDRADRLAAAGQHQAALQALAEVPREDADWRKQRDARERQWKAALALKATLQKQRPGQ